MTNVGILGFGKMGSFHADWISHTEGLKLIAVCDKQPGRREAAESKYGVRGYTDLDKFLNDSSMNLVVIVTTNDVHEELTIKALRAGKDVIVEKPMSLSYKSTLRMIEAAEQTGNRLYVHHSSRWDRDYLLIKDIIRSGIIGDILQVHSKVMLCDEGWPAWGIDGMDNPWRIKAQYGGGILFDWGPHLVDQALQMMGKEPCRVFGSLQSGIWTKEVDDHFFAMLEFENDVVWQIEASNNGRITLPRWYVIGTMGTILVEGYHEPFWDKAEILYTKPNGKQEKQTFTLIDVCESGAEGGFYLDLLPHLEGKKEDFVTMYEASSVVKILESVKQSHEKKRIIEIA